MKKLKTFENFVPGNDYDINIILDVSGSISHSELEDALYQISDSCEPSNITLIQVSDSVESVDTFDNLDEIMGVKDFTRIMRGAQGGTNLQAGVDYVIDNDLADLKTFIISDFYTGKLDYSGLADYEEIRVEEGKEDMEELPVHLSRNNKGRVSGFGSDKTADNIKWRQALHQEKRNNR